MWCDISVQTSDHKVDKGASIFAIKTSNNFSILVFSFYSLVQSESSLISHISVFEYQKNYLFIYLFIHLFITING